MYAEGYKYWLAYKTNATSYYRCCRYISSKCPGRCIDEDGTVRSTTAHNHSPEPDRALVDKFRKILTQRAANEKTELYAIYCDEATSRHSDAAMLYPFESAKSAMRKARRKQLPQTPNIVTDIVDILDTSDLFRVNSGSDKDSIYQKTIRLEDSVCMIFMHRKTIELFGRIDEIHLDGSVEFAPETPPSYHLITVHAIQGYITAPIIYALVTTKTPSAYAALFAYIREDLNILPNTIVSDFDHTMQSSLAYIFPEAVIKGCWFHYTDTVLCQMRNLNLQKETHKGAGASALRMLLVLPLLPAEYMSPGLESLKKWMKDKNIFSDAFSCLCDHVEHSWLRAVGAEKMSIFGTSRNISNHLKNFNKELTSTIGTGNPAIWVILESITQLATKTYVKVNKKMRLSNTEQSKSSGPNAHNKHTSGRVPRKSEQFTEAIISSATQLWIRTPVHLRNPLQFLQLSSHCINDAINLTSLSGMRNGHSNSLESPDLLRKQSSWCQQKTSTFLQKYQREAFPVSSLSDGQLQELPYTQLGAIICTNNMNDSNTQSSNLTTMDTNFQTTTVSNESIPVCSEKSIIPQRSGEISKEPPPLAFFPAVKRIIHKRRLPILSEPPPLVPISSKNFKN